MHYTFYRVIIVVSIASLYFYLVFLFPALRQQFQLCFNKLILQKKGQLAYNKHFLLERHRTNSIELSEAAADDKKFILDINVSLNNKATINLEMQMADRKDWRGRSLNYLCRSFDQLHRGAEYDEVKPTIHIGFLNFSPDSNAESEFYASYRLLNEKSHTLYSDKFILRVVNLTQIDLATEEDKINRIDYWARLFTATSWEDIQMIVKNNDFLSSASQSLYESNADDIIRQKCRAREEYCKLERAAQKFDDKNKASKQELDEKNSVIAEQDSVIAEKESEIAELKKQLAQAQK